MRKICEHDARHLAIETIDYNTEYTTSTKQDHRVVCNLCGKVLVPHLHFDAIKRLLTRPIGQGLELYIMIRKLRHGFVELSQRYKGGGVEAFCLQMLDFSKDFEMQAGQDRENLEWLVYQALRDENPCISISRGRELLGFDDMMQMREWLNAFAEKFEKINARPYCVKRYCPRNNQGYCLSEDGCKWGDMK